MKKLSITREPPPVGGPTKFRPPTLKRILSCARRGMPLSLCAAAVGVSAQGLRNYRTTNPKFEEALQRAIARGVDARLRKIEQASSEADWRAAAWLLEHCQPQHFAKNRLEVTGADGAPLAAGLHLYLPEKQGSVVEAGAVVEAPALTEGKPDGTRD